MKKKNCKIFLTSGRSDCCSLQRSEAKGLARGEVWIEDMVWLSDQVAGYIWSSFSSQSSRINQCVAQLHQGNRPGHREEGGVLVQLPCHPGSQVLPLFQTQLSLCPVLASNVSYQHLSQSSELFNISRYGLVMSIVATRDLVAGEEIFVSYNYALEKAPEWYQVLQPSIKMIFVRYLRVLSFKSSYAGNLVCSPKRRPRPERAGNLRVVRQVILDSTPFLSLVILGFVTT